MRECAYAKQDARGVSRPGQDRNHLHAETDHRRLTHGMRMRCAWRVDETACPPNKEQERPLSTFAQNYVYSTACASTLQTPSCTVPVLKLTHSRAILPNIHAVAVWKSVGKLALVPVNSRVPNSVGVPVEMSNSRPHHGMSTGRFSRACGSQVCELPRNKETTTVAATGRMLVKQSKVPLLF